MRIAPFILLSACLGLLGFAAPAAAEAGNGEAAPAVRAPIEFLRAVEERNQGVQTLHGKFSQVRSNEMFLEEIHSEGEFWYARPSQFRADYHTPTLARFYLIGNRGMYYTPELNQLEKFTFRSTNGRAPINQMLVGFGLDTDAVLDVFTVVEADEQPEDPGLYAIRFVSKDLERSMEFTRITVTFDRGTFSPRILFMEEQGGDTVKVVLESVEFDADIPADKFNLDFPADVEVIEY